MVYEWWSWWIILIFWRVLFIIIWVCFELRSLLWRKKIFIGCCYSFFLWVSMFGIRIFFIVLVSLKLRNLWRRLVSMCIWWLNSMDWVLIFIRWVVRRLLGVIIRWISFSVLIIFIFWWWGRWFLCIFWKSVLSGLLISMGCWVRLRWLLWFVRSFLRSWRWFVIGVICLMMRRKLRVCR